MKKRFTEEQIIKILREGENGKRIEVCRRHGITETTFYRWRKKYQGMTVHSIKEMKQLKAENARLKKLVAEQAIANQVLKEYLEKKRWI
jgi:putative transposase